MRILLVTDMSIDKQPPVRSLITVLLKKGHKVTLVTIDSANCLGGLIDDENTLKCIVLSKYNGNNIINKVFSYLHINLSFKSIVKREMRDNDLLWTITDTTIARLGKLVLRYKHVMELLELVENIPALPRQKIFRVNAKKYAQHALQVVIPEYNRAHILKAWWDLEKLPVVLPNKPVEEKVDAQNAPEEVRDILREIANEKRKIVLYQGVFNKDRDLSKFADAIEDLCDEYALYVMGNKNGREQFIDPVLKGHSNAHYIPFILPPYHLLVTEKAHIGLLPYKASREMGNNSVLNAVYCAPNKIFEYAKYGVPMLGSDMPGLMHPFTLYDIGYTCETQSAEEIKDNIRKIESRYDEMRANCKKFYDSVDLDGIIEKILHEAE